MKPTPEIERTHTTNEQSAKLCQWNVESVLVFRENEKRNLVYMWMRRHQLATVQLICIVVHWIMCHRKNYVSRPTKQSRIHKQNVRDELMNHFRLMKDVEIPFVWDLKHL